MTHTPHIPDNDERQLPQFNRMQTIKRRFFAMRNGALAQQMRSGGLDYRINFGLNIPQIKEIAREVASWGLTDTELAGIATELWHNTSTRESMLMAPMIFPTGAMTDEIAAEWLSEAPTTEVADMLCHSLLRHLTCAPAIAAHLLGTLEATDINRYASLRLMFNLLMLGQITPGALAPEVDAERLRTCGLTAPLCRQILQEIEFLSEPE